MSETPERPALVPQRHGGALLAAGVVGNRGGPGAPPSELRARLRGALAERVRIIEEIADNESANTTDRLRALGLLCSYGLGALATREVSVEAVREKLAATIEAIGSELPA